MSLYHIQFDGEAYYVECPTMIQAVALWKMHMGQEGDEEPESISLLHAGSVIRAR